MVTSYFLYLRHYARLWRYGDECDKFSVLKDFHVKLCDKIMGKLPHKELGKIWLVSETLWGNWERFHLK